VLPLSSFIELALESDNLRHGYALLRQEDLVGLGIYTLYLALVVVIIRHLATNWESMGTNLLAGQLFDRVFGSF
jgi:hypothetical protein